MAYVLIIGGNQERSRALAFGIQRAGHKVAVVGALEAGLAKSAQVLFDVVFLDVHLPDGSGLDGLRELRAGLLPPEVIIIANMDDVKSMETAIQWGAWDIYHKDAPFDLLMLSLVRALQYRESQQPQLAPTVFHSSELIGHSPHFLAALNTAAQAANSDVNVLITGETGVGKELFAAAIHENSQRAKEAFVVVDCSALPETLIASTLFGHEKGAFTGADSAHKGLVAIADGGTLFLDEVGDMPIEIQKAFLRVLQERRFRPIGSQQEMKSDFRIIAATHRDLDALVKQNLFRKDLLFRLRTMTVNVPPLRERKDDIPLLAAHFIHRKGLSPSSAFKGVSEGFAEALKSYSWPGNVRELAQAIASALATAANNPILFTKHLPHHIRIHLARIKINSPSNNCVNDCIYESDIGPNSFEEALLSYREMRMEFERAYFEALIRQADHNIETACRIAQLSRPHIYALLRKHNLKL